MTLSTKHLYVSTACVHELHHSCRKECKFCKEPCRCPCHATKPTPPPGSVREVKV